MIYIENIQIIPIGSSNKERNIKQKREKMLNDTRRFVTFLMFNAYEFIAASG